jgi:hypothetical protein
MNEFQITTQYNQKKCVVLILTTSRLFLAVPQIHRRSATTRPLELAVFIILYKISLNRLS